MLDTTTETGARAERRMREEEISWRRWCVLTTIRSRCPSVWFLWEGETFLVYSQPRRRQGKKLRNIERNPRAGLNLNSNAQGGDVVRVEGMAEIVEDAPPLTEVLEYVEEVPGRHRQDRLRPGQLRAGLLRHHPGDVRALASLVA